MQFGFQKKLPIILEFESVAAEIFAVFKCMTVQDLISYEHVSEGNNALQPVLSLWTALLGTAPCIPTQVKPCNQIAVPGGVQALNQANNVITKLICHQNNSLCMKYSIIN